jgi:hypothetical protein
MYRIHIDYPDQFMILSRETKIVNYEFRVKTMYSSSLPSVVCRRDHVICVCLRIVVKQPLDGWQLDVSCTI